MGGGGGTFSGQTMSVSATTTAQEVNFNRVYSVLLRTPSSNTDNINVNLGGVTASSGDMLIRINETIAIDISPVLIAKLLQNKPLFDNDFIRSISVRAASGTQTLYFDVLRFDA